MEKFEIKHTEGTHRIISPEETFAKIEPSLKKCGITRCADITGLDNIGIPTFAAIRPPGIVLQTSNGKGITPMAAKVSALMEAIEVDHAERPLIEKLHLFSMRELLQKKECVYNPKKLEMLQNVYWNADFRIFWTQGTNLATGEKIWFPANYIYFLLEPTLFETSSNGLASGNHILEAELHALYELIERDAISNIFKNGTLRIHDHCLVIDNQSLEESSLKEVVQKIERAGNKLVLMRVDYPMEVHTFWSFIVNLSGFSSVSTLNFGYGTHIDPVVAACRAVTEAAQSRLTFIHGCREDIGGKRVFGSQDVENSPAFRLFRTLSPNSRWEDLPHFDLKPFSNISKTRNFVLKQILDTGKGPVFRFDLQRPEVRIPVVRLIAPLLKVNPKLF